MPTILSQTFDSLGAEHLILWNILSFFRYLLSIYFMPIPMLGAADAVVSKSHQGTKIATKEGYLLFYSPIPLFGTLSPLSNLYKAMYIIEHREIAS